MLTSLLIANRGEIACRIIRTARRLGIRTVAVYSDADAKALHVRQAGAAVHIGASPAAESYLRADRIIAAARESGAEAIHPGYGFLSENADFAQAVIDAGLIWVGPRPESIRAMGLKDAAKRRMQQAGVPTTPGYLGGDQAPERLFAEAEAIGWPVLIKAVAGGGGKGMRRVDAADQFMAALEACRREAASSFGDDRVLLEKYIFSPRHIEVQVFGDTHGNLVHLFERDCSLQRRHQKVIEEAPAPGMNAGTREAVCGAAIKAARAVDYVGAGTIEFIADASAGLRADRIWFMEMNTRLQVEHPVTEAITGVDLVEWQLRVASGEPLPKRQDELAIDGHAIEARLYAEDPAKGFLPSVGWLERFRLPDKVRPPSYVNHLGEFIHTNLSSAVLRIDSGVDEGAEISSFYDPMIAKVVCHATERSEAAVALGAVINDVQVWPIRTNATFLSMLLTQAEFLTGNADTGFIERRHDRLCFELHPQDWLVDRATELLMLRTQGRLAGLAGFRLNGSAAIEVRLADRDRGFIGRLRRRLSYNQAHHALIEREGESVFATQLGSTWRFTTPRFEGKANTAFSDGAILSPMPGRITAVVIGQGEAVTAGQTLVTLEAMKMEQALVAPFDGTVAEVNVAEGAQVEEGRVLVRVERGDDA